MSTRSWEAEDGSKRYKAEIVADSVILLSGKPGSGSESSEEWFQKDDAFGDAPQQEEPVRQVSQRPGAKNKYKPKQEEEIHIDDIPF